MTSASIGGMSLSTESVAKAATSGLAARTCHVTEAVKVGTARSSSSSRTNHVTYRLDLRSGERSEDLPTDLKATVAIVARAEISPTGTGRARARVNIGDFSWECTCEADEERECPAESDGGAPPGQQTKVCRTTMTGHPTVTGSACILPPGEIPLPDPKQPINVTTSTSASASVDSRFSGPSAMQTVAFVAVHFTPAQSQSAQRSYVWTAEPQEGVDCGRGTAGQSTYDNGCVTAYQNCLDGTGQPLGTLPDPKGCLKDFERCRSSANQDQLLGENFARAGFKYLCEAACPRPDETSETCPPVEPTGAKCAGTIRFDGGSDGGR